MLKAIFGSSFVKEDLIDKAKKAFDSGEVEQACKHLSEAQSDVKLMQKKKAEYNALAIEISNAITEIKRSVEDATRKRKDIASNVKRLTDNLMLLARIRLHGFFDEADFKQTAEKVQEYFEKLLKNFDDPRNATKKLEFLKTEKAVLAALETLQVLDSDYWKSLQLKKFHSLHENFKQYYTKVVREIVETDLDLATPINIDSIESNIRTLPDRLKKLEEDSSAADYEGIKFLVDTYFAHVYLFFSDSQNMAQKPLFMKIEELLFSFLDIYLGGSRLLFSSYYADESIQEIESGLNVPMDNKSISNNVKMLFEQMPKIKRSEEYELQSQPQKKYGDVVEKIIAYFESVFQYLRNNPSNLQETVLFYLEKLAKLDIRFKPLYAHTIHEMILNDVNAPVDVNNIFETLYNNAQKIATHLQTLKNNLKEEDYDQLVQKIIDRFKVVLPYINQIKTRKEFVFTNGIISSLKKLQEVDSRFEAVVNQLTDALHKILEPLLNEQDNKTSQLISELRAQEVFRDKSIAPLISSYVFAEVINRETQKAEKAKTVDLVIARDVQLKFYYIKMNHLDFISKVLFELNEIMSKKECSVTELLNDLIKYSNMKKFLENHPLDDERNSSERAVGVGVFIKSKLNELEARDPASPEYFKMLQEFEEFFESKKDVIHEFDQSKNLISTYEKLKKKAKRYINDLEEKLADAWRNLKNHDVNTVAVVIETLVEIKKHNDLYVKAGLSNQKTLNAYLGDNGHFHQYLLEINKAISESANQTVPDSFYELLKILTGFVNNGFDSHLTFAGHETLNSENLHEKLFQWIEQAERFQIAELKTYCDKEDRASFIALYHQVKQSQIMTSEKINSELELISTLMLKKITLASIEEMINTALMDSEKDFKDMTKTDLKSYFEYLSKIQNDVDVFKFLKQKMDKFNSNNHQILFERYAAQVKAFEAILQEDAKTTKNYRELHGRFSLIRDAFMDQESKTVVQERREFKQTFLLENKKYKHITLPEESQPEDIHQPLKDCVSQYEQKYFMQGLIAECNQYAEMNVEDYSEKLQEFIAFLETFGTEYQVFYNHLMASLTKNILAFIKGNPHNYGWDVLENLSTLDKRKQFIPEVVWEVCRREIEAAEKNAMEEQKLEQENVFSNKFSIANLAERVANASHEHYHESYRNYIYPVYVAAVTEFKDEIDTLLTSNVPNNFYIAIKELDSQWYNIRRSRTLHNLQNLTHLEDAVVKHIINQFTTAFDAIPVPLTEDQHSFDAIHKAYVKIQSFIYLCGSNTSPGKGSLSDKLWNHETSREPLKLVQRIINFYVTLIDDFHQSLAERNFDNVLKTWELLRNNDAEIKAFSQLVSENSQMLTNLNITCTAIKTEDWKSLIQQKVSELTEIKLDIANDPRIWSDNSKERKDVHSSVFGTYLGLESYCSSGIWSKLDKSEQETSELLKEANETVVSNFTRIQTKAVNEITQISVLNINACVIYNKAYENLKAAQNIYKNSELFLKNINENINSLSEHFIKILEDGVALVRDEKFISANELVSFLIKLKMASKHLGQFKKEIHNKIDELLNCASVGDFPMCSYLELKKALQDEKNPDYEAFAHHILTEHRIFESDNIEMRNRETLFYGIDDMCEKLSRNPNNSALNIAEIRKNYAKFETEYNEHVHAGLKEKNVTPELYKKRISDVMNNQSLSYADRVARLAAIFFAYWSVKGFENHKKADLSDEISAEAFEELKMKMLRPHPAQVIAIFRLLGVDIVDNTIQDDETYLQNQLLECLTGEGKSILLGVTSMILAAQGYEIDCSCYSGYLSLRDDKAFQHMFDAFGLRDKIFYGTFKELSEQWINEKYGDVRETVDQLVRGTQENKPKKREKQNNNKRVLLIDEVDTFLGDDTCGETYSLSHIFSSKKVFELIQFIWKESAVSISEASLNLEAIQGNEKSGYKKLIETSSEEFISILNNAILAMIEDVKLYRTHPSNFVFDKDKGIGYRTNDHVPEFNISYRYQTMFALIDRFEKKEISRKKLEGKIGVLIKIGEFSYAEMVKEYKHRSGVTGTLSNLGVAENKRLDGVLRAEKFTYMPSVYGKDQHANFPSNETVKCVAMRNHYQAITEEIKKYQHPIGKVIRPVMVFFKTPEEMARYYEQYKSVFDQNKIVYLDENITDEVERENRISRATAPGAILLATRPNGRGVDFKCYGESLNQAGGPHVIMTFVPKDKAEEKQIIGRTARQGKNGSCSMVLNEQEIQKELEIAPQALLDSKISGIKLYETIDSARTTKLESEYAKSEEKLAQAQEVHTTSTRFIEDLYDNNKSDSDRLNQLSRFNQFESVKSASNASHAGQQKKTYKTVCAIDATGSMENVLWSVKGTIDETYNRALQVLQENQVDAEIQIQFAFYQNYNSPERFLLQVSEWYGANDLDALKAYLSNITANYGDDREAAEVAFAHINRTPGVDNVIWIGDIEPHSDEEADRKREKHRKNEWVERNFGGPVYFNVEIQKVMEKNILVNAFWIKGALYSDGFGKQNLSSKERYKKVAEDTRGKDDTRGKYGELDFSDPAKSQKSKDDLLDAITGSILRNINPDLEAAYYAKYRPTYAVNTPNKKHAPRAVANSAMYSGSSSSSPTDNDNEIIISKEIVREVLSSYLESTNYVEKSTQSQQFLLPKVGVFNDAYAENKKLRFEVQSFLNNEIETMPSKDLAAQLSKFGDRSTYIALRAERYEVFDWQQESAAESIQIN